MKVPLISTQALKWSRMESGILNGKVGNRTIVTVAKHTGDGHFIVSFKPLVKTQHTASEDTGKALAHKLMRQFLVEGLGLSEIIK